MENVFIDSAEKIHSMSDLAAVIDEYRYNCLVDSNFIGRMRNCHIEDGNGVKKVNNFKKINKDETRRN